MKEIYIIPDYGDMEQSLALAEKYNCAFEYNDFYQPQVLDDTKRQQEMIQQYRQYGRDMSEDTMHGAFLDVTIHSSDDRIREVSMLRVRQSMDIAKAAGIHGVVFHSGRLAGFRVDYYIRKWLADNEAFFRQLSAQYPEQQIFMENMFDEKPDILAALAERLADVENFGICLDYAHAAITHFSIEQWVEVLAPYICHMHINDNNLEDDSHDAVGDGAIDWNKFNRLMRQNHIHAPVLVEVNGIEKQKRSLEYMQRHCIYPFH